MWDIVGQNFKKQAQEQSPLFRDFFLVGKKRYIVGQNFKNKHKNNHVDNSMQQTHKLGTPSKWIRYTLCKWIKSNF